MKTFREAIQGEEFTVTAELTLKRDSSADDVRRQAAILGPCVDGIQVSDNPWAWVQMSSQAASALLLQEGIDPVPIMTCRDRNRIALQSDLIGLRTLGATSVVLVRGHRIPRNHSLPANTVFDIGGRELITMAHSLADDDSLGPGPDFFIGTGARIFRPNRGWRGESLMERSKAGAQFVQTQMCFNLDALGVYMSRMVDAKVTWKYSVMVSLAVLPSAQTARWLKQNLRDSMIPEELIQRLEDADDPVQEGIDIAAETMREISAIPGVSGVNLMTTGDPEAIAAAIAASGLREAR